MRRIVNFPLPSEGIYTVIDGMLIRREGAPEGAERLSRFRELAAGGIVYRRRDGGRCALTEDRVLYLSGADVGGSSEELPRLLEEWQAWRELRLEARTLAVPITFGDTGGWTFSIFDEGQTMAARFPDRNSAVAALELFGALCSEQPRSSFADEECVVDASTSSLPFSSVGWIRQGGLAWPSPQVLAKLPPQSRSPLDICRDEGLDVASRLKELEGLYGANALGEGEPVTGEPHVYETHGREERWWLYPDDASATAAVVKAALKMGVALELNDQVWGCTVDDDGEERSWGLILPPTAPQWERFWDPDLFQRP